jgi:CP family cyanate transporter-like MFS transporter
VIMLLAPRQATPASAQRTQSWWPDWSDPLIWKLGIALGAANAMYFTTNAFLPDYLHHLGRADLISTALTTLNVAQIPASLLLLAIAHRIERSIWPHIVCGAAAIAAVAGIMVLPAPGVVVCAAVLGFCAATILILMLAMPALLAPPGDVHRVAGAMFTISYSLAVITPICSGLAWDLTGRPSTAFLSIGACALILILVAPTIRFDRPSA